MPKTLGHPLLPVLALGHLCIRSWDHYNDVIMSVVSSLITSLTIVCSSVYSGADQRKHQSSASLAFVSGIHRWQVNLPYNWSVTRKMMTSSCKPTGPRHHGGCRSADTRPSVTAMPTLQLLNNSTNVINNAGEVSAGRQTVSFLLLTGSYFYNDDAHCE